MAFIKYFLITLLILYIIRVILRLVFPIVIKNMFGKVQQQAANNAQQAKRQQSKPDGSISIDYMPPQPKSGNADKLGDFVDYEEIK